MSVLSLGVAHLAYPSDRTPEGAYYRVVIAVNLNSDLFGRGTIIASHGSDDSDEAARAADGKSNGGLLGIFGRERTLRRQIMGRRGRPGIPTVMIEAFNVMQDRITRARLAGDPPDVLVSPRLGQVGWFDFHRAAEAIAIGAEATEKAIDAMTEAVTALSQPFGADAAMKATEAAKEAAKDAAKK